MSKSVSVQAIWLVAFLSILFFLLTPGVVVTAPLLIPPNEPKEAVGLIYKNPEKATSLTAAVYHTVVFSVLCILSLVAYTYYNSNSLSSASSAGSDVSGVSGVSGGSAVSGDSGCSFDSGFLY